VSRLSLREALLNDDLETGSISYAQLSSNRINRGLDKLDLKFTRTHPKSYLYCTEDNVLPANSGVGIRECLTAWAISAVQMPVVTKVMFSNPIGLAERLLWQGATSSRICNRQPTNVAVIPQTMT